MFPFRSKAEPKRPAPVVLPSSKVTQFHPVQLAITDGDVMVLATHNFEEPNLSKPLGVFTFEQSSDQSWSLVDTNGTRFGLSHNLTKVGHEFTLSMVYPVTEFTQRKGICTLFQAHIRNGYRLHYIDFVRNRLPGLYQQVSDSFMS